MPVTAELLNDGSTVRIVPPARFDISSHGDFREAYSRYDPGLNYVVDLRATEYIDSSALGMLLLLRKHAGDTGRVKLLGPQPEVRNSLSIVNFDTLFVIE